MNIKKFLLSLAGGVGLTAQPTNYVESLPELPVLGNQGKVVVVDQRFYQADNNGFLFTIGAGTGNNAGFSNRSVESFGSTTAPLSGQIEVQWGTSGTSVRVFFEQAEFPSAPGHLYWSIEINGVVHSFDAVRQSTTGFFFYDDTSEILSATSGTAEVKFWQDFAYSQPFTVRSDAGWKEFFRSFDSITQLSTDGRYLISYRGVNDPNPARLLLPSTELVPDGAHSIRLVSSDGISRTYAFDNSDGTELFRLRTENAITNAITDLDRHSSNDTALELLRGHMPDDDARRTETLDLQPIVTAGESKAAFDNVAFDPATGDQTFTAEDTTTQQTISFPSYLTDAYLTNSPANSLVIFSPHGNTIRTIPFAPTINTLASNMVTAFNLQTGANVNASIANSVVNIEKGSGSFNNRLIWTTRGGTINNIDLERWYEPDTGDRIFQVDGEDVDWDDLIRGVGENATHNNVDALAFQRMDNNDVFHFAPRGANWTISQTASSGGNIVTITDNSNPQRTSSVLIPSDVLQADQLSITNLTLDASTGVFTLDRRGTDTFLNAPFPIGGNLNLDDRLLTITRGGQAAPLLLPVTGNLAAAAARSACTADGLRGPVTLANNILTFQTESAGNVTVNLSSIASGSALTLSGYATLMNTAGTTTTVNPSNFYFVVVDAAGNVNRVSVATMESEFERSEVTNTALTANATSTASTTTAPSRRQVEIALAGIEAGGGGTDHAGVVEIVKDFTGQTGTTNAPGTFNLNRLPIGGTASVGNFVGYDANGLVYTNAPAGGGGIAISAVKPFARTGDTTSQMPTATLAQPTSTLGGSAIDTTNDRVLLYDSSASGYAQSSPTEFGVAMETVLSDRLNPDPSTFTSSDDGTFPAWDTDRWVNGMFEDANGFTWTFDTSTDDWTVSYSRGPPAGGTSGQILAKASNTDYAFEWITPAAGGGGLSTVASDATLTGTGAQSSPLSVANPFTQIDEEKLDSLRIETRDLFSTTMTVGTSTPGPEQWSGTAVTGFGDSAADSGGNYSTFGAIAANMVNVDGTNHRIYALYENTAQTEIILFIGGNPDLDGYELEIGNNFLAFNQAYEDLDTGDTGAAYSSYSWHANNFMPASGSTDVDVAINRGVIEKDYVPADATDGQILAFASNRPDWIDGVSRLLIPGGTVNQVLTKTGAGDYQVTWLDAQGRQIPAGSALPASPRDGDQFILTSTENVPQDHVLRAIQADSQSRTIQLTSQSGLPHQVIAYAPALLGVNASLANKVYVVYNGAPTKTASKLTLHADRLQSQDYNISTQAPTGFSHWRQVTGLSYSDIQANHEYYVNVQFSDNTKLFPDRPYVLGHYIYSTVNGWEFAPGIAAPWAVQGRREPRTLLSLTQLIDGPGEGVTTQSGSSAASSVFRLFDPDGSPTNFDLDDTENANGLLEIEATLRFASSSHTTVGFDSTALQTKRETDFMFASALRSSSVYSATVRNGILADTWSINNTANNSHIGDVSLYLARNSANQLGYYFYYEPDAGGASINFSIQSTLEIAFLHNDGAGQGIPAGGDDGQVLVKTSDDDYQTAWTNRVTKFTDLSDTPTDAQLTSAQGDIVVVAPSANAITTLDSLSSQYIANGAITSAKLGADAVTSAKIANSAVGATELASGAVTGAKIASGAVDNAKLADGAVGTDEIASSAVTSAKIASNAVTSAKINASAVTAAKIANSAIDPAKLNSDSLTEQAAFRTRIGFQQPDWTESNTTSPDYIRNKPVIPSAETGATIKGKLEGLSGSSRLNYSAIMAGPPANAEQNVQSDWNATSGDSFIQNKPTIPSAPESWAVDGNTEVIPTTKLGTGDADETKVLFGNGTWGTAPAGSADTAAQIRNKLQTLTGNDRLRFQDIQGKTWISLTETPASIEANKFVRGNSAGNGLEFVDAPSGGSTTFLGLTDVTPTTYVGQAHKVVAVNAAANALELVPASTIGGAGVVGSTNLLSYIRGGATLTSYSFSTAFTQVPTLQGGALNLGFQLPTDNASQNGILFIDANFNTSATLTDKGSSIFQWVIPVSEFKKMRITGSSAIGGRESYASTSVVNDGTSAGDKQTIHLSRGESSDGIQILAFASDNSDVKYIDYLLVRLQRSSDGADGMPGDDGAAGPAGPAGPKGDKGDTGSLTSASTFTNLVTWTTASASAFSISSSYKETPAATAFTIPSGFENGILFFNAHISTSSSVIDTAGSIAEWVIPVQVWNDLNSVTDGSSTGSVDGYGKDTRLASGAYRGTFITKGANGRVSLATHSTSYLSRLRVWVFNGLGAAGDGEAQSGLSDAEHTFPTLTASPGTLSWTDITHSEKVLDDDLFGYSIILRDSSDNVVAKCNIPFGWGDPSATGTGTDYRYLYDQSIGQARIKGRFIVGSGNGYKIDIDQIPATWSGRTIEIRNYGLN